MLDYNEITVRKYISLDGEPYMGQFLEFKLLPKALKVLAAEKVT